MFARPLPAHSSVTRSVFAGRAWISAMESFNGVRTRPVTLSVLSAAEAT